jgi:hypothetical protein
MFYTKVLALVLGVLFFFTIFNSCAQWSPGGMMVYMGDLNLAGDSGDQGAAPYVIGRSLTVQAPLNTLNNSSLNNSLINNSTMICLPALAPLDLSGYGSDRASKNLAGYRNIMYPMGESRGSTTTTGGASGGCCG